MLNKETIDLLSKVSLAVVLMVIIITGALGYWVFGTTYTEVVKEKNEWKSLAIEGLKTAEDAKHIRLGTPVPSTASLEEVQERLETIKNVESD